MGVVVGLFSISIVNVELNKGKSIHEKVYRQAVVHLELDVSKLGIKEFDIGPEHFYKKVNSNYE